MIVTCMRLHPWLGTEPAGPSFFDSCIQALTPTYANTQLRPERRN